MTIRDIQQLVDDQSLTALDFRRRVASWKDAVFDLYLSDWTFHDFRPRDEWFSIHAEVRGQAHELRLFIQDSGRLIGQKKADLFTIGTCRQLTPIHVQAIVQSDCSTLSTGLFLDLLDYKIDEQASSISNHKI